MMLNVGMVTKLEKHGEDGLVKLPLAWMRKHGLKTGEVVEFTLIAGVGGKPHRIILKKVAT